LTADKNESVIIHDFGHITGNGGIDLAVIQHDILPAAQKMIFNAAFKLDYIGNLQDIVPGHIVLAGNQKSQGR
jgi:hypothetical protein